MRKKLRILHLPIAISYQPYLFAKGLKKLGHTADYIVLSIPEHDKWLMQGRPDINLNVFTYQRNFKNLLKTIRDFFKIIQFFIISLLKYDIYHFHSYCISILIFSGKPRLMRFFSFLEINILKLFRKKIIFNFWGCDIRLRSQNEKYKYNTCNVCKLKGECNTEFKEWLNKFTKKYADIRLSGGDLLTMYQDFKKLNPAIDTALWNPSKIKKIPKKFKIQKKENIKVFSCQGNLAIRGDIRGIDFINKAIRELQEEGYKIEKLFFDKVNNLDLRYYQIQADICIDQLRYGFHAISALESMALGKPVIAYIREDVGNLYPGLPIINATPENIKSVLRETIKNIEGMSGKNRAYIVKHHDYRKVAKELEKYYYSLF